jgi:hypothetical protein
MIVLAVFLGVWAGPLIALVWLVWREWRRDRATRDAETRARGLAERAHGLPPGPPDVIPLWARGNPRDVASRDWPR